MIWAKAICSVAIGVVSMCLALAIGALGNVIGTAITGTETVWNVSAGEFSLIVLANVLGLLVGFMLGVSGALWLPPRSPSASPRC